MISKLASSFLCVFTSATLFAQTSSLPEDTSERIMLAPTQAGDAEELLVLVPGMQKPAEEYRSLATSVQASSPVKLWVAILKFAQNAPNPVQLGGRISGVWNELNEAGVAANPQNTFIAAHSLGGIVSQGFAEKNKVAGLILLASYLTNSPSLETLQTPVLTLGGELDGLTRITRLAQEVQATQRYNGNPLRFPVIVLPGVNHSQFSGVVQMKTDLNPVLSYEEAQARISQTIADFMMLNTPQTAQKEVIEARLSEGIASTKTLVRAYLQAQSTDTQWCSEGQRVFSGPLALRLNVQETTQQGLSEFAGSKPAVQVLENGQLGVQVYSNFKMPNNPLDIASNPLAPQEIACKMKSREALNALAELPQNTEPSCAEINAKAFETAFQSLRPEVQERYLNHGKKMRFTEDQSYGTGIQWLPSSLQAKLSSENTLDITTPALLTGLGSGGRFSGQHYCKLLAPSRAAEWIMVDSLRP